ncbi:hypothetical protein E4U39_002936 [Claviceps sp. Clav50 group G5]|nr:hypothetical protein E4U39_002936 [Claviceps sp. Clav50 group G5]
MNPCLPITLVWTVSCGLQGVSSEDILIDGFLHQGFVGKTMDEALDEIIQNVFLAGRQCQGDDEPLFAYHTQVCLRANSPGWLHPTCEDRTGQSSRSRHEDIPVSSPDGLSLPPAWRKRLTTRV